MLPHWPWARSWKSVLKLIATILSAERFTVELSAGEVIFRVGTYLAVPPQERSRLEPASRDAKKRFIGVLLRNTGSVHHLGATGRPAGAVPSSRDRRGLREAGGTSSGSSEVVDVDVGVVP